MLQNLLRTSPLLSAVDPSEREGLVAKFETRTFEAGDHLVTKGNQPTGLHLIASGKVEVSAVDDAGERLQIATLGPGEVVGEVALILRRSHNANVIALSPSVTLHLSSSAFQEMLRAHPTLLAQLYELAVKRDEETSSVVAQEATNADDLILL